MEYLVVALSALVALGVIADSRVRDPYFAFYELVPGMGVADAAIAGDQRTRAAIIRRFGYGLVLGILLAVAGIESPIHAVAAGVTVTVLLLWPMAIHGVPSGKLRSDWMLAVLYTAVAFVYTSAVLAGQAFFVLVAERDVVQWLRDELLTIVVAAVLAAMAFGVLDGWLPRARRPGR